MSAAMAGSMSLSESRRRPNPYRVVSVQNPTKGVYGGEVQFDKVFCGAKPIVASSKEER